jgi:molecular chaperone DnaJ
MRHPDDLYLILDVVRTASVGDIKKAFRRLARRYHPDINPGDLSAEEQFKRITEAYEVLSDPEKRQFYDQHGYYAEGVLETAESRSTWRFAFKGFDFSDPHKAPVDEAFSQFFMRQAERREPQRGADLEYQMAIGFAESMRGFPTSISVQRRRRCDACNGSGRGASANDAHCPACGGAGRISRPRGRLQFVMTCEACSGSGRAPADCPECGGEGRSLRADNLEVQIPAGVANGSRIRIPGQGDAGRYGGPAGDLFVITNVAPHPYFTRAGDNIQCSLPISIWEAALGAKVDVPTVDGSAVLRIPPGTQNGQVFRLRGKGAPSLLQPGGRGDQFVEVTIAIPRVADERSKEILRELARLNPEDPRTGIWKP